MCGRVHANSKAVRSLFTTPVFMPRADARLTTLSLKERQERGWPGWSHEPQCIVNPTPGFKFCHDALIIDIDGLPYLGDGFTQISDLYSDLASSALVH